jgi:WD40 repeat protein
MIPRLVLCLLAAFAAAAVHSAERPLTKLWSVVITNQSATTAALSKDGQWIAIAGYQYQIQIRRATDGSWVKTLEHGGSVIALEFSSDGTLLASTGRDEQLKLWSVPQGTLIAALANVVSAQSGEGGAIAFSPDDTLLASTRKSSPTNLAIWHMRPDPPKPEFLHELVGHTNGVNAIDFSPDGKFMATGGGFRGRDLTVKIWDPLNGELIKTLQTSNTYGIDDVAFSPDGKILATGTDTYSSFAGNVELWNTTDWSLLRRLPGKGSQLAFSPDGEFLVTLRDRSTLDIWRVATGTLVRSYVLPGSEFGSLATVRFMPDGNSLIIAGFNNGGAVPHGYLNAVRFPGRELEFKVDANALELTWLQGAATLQTKTNLTAEWTDVAASTTGVNRVSLDRAAGFFRLKATGTTE